MDIVAIELPETLTVGAILAEDMGKLDTLGENVVVK